MTNAAALLSDPMIGLLAGADGTIAVTARLMYQRHGPLIVTVKSAWHYRAIFCTSAPGRA